MSFILKHQLTDDAVNDFLTIMNLHLPNVVSPNTFSTKSSTTKLLTVIISVVTARSILEQVINVTQTFSVPVEPQNV